MRGSLVSGQYDDVVDRESAYEVLKRRAEQKTAPAPLPSRGGREPDTMIEAAAKSVLRAAGSQLGRQVMRGILGTIFGGRR
jgi:hypothetical protein